MHLMKRPEKIYGGDTWNIVENDFDPQRNRLSESIFSVSNEHMGVRGYFEEGYSGDQLLGSYFNGLYDYLSFWFLRNELNLLYLQIALLHKGSQWI